MSSGRSMRRFGWVGLALAVLCAVPVVAAPVGASAVTLAHSAAVPVLRWTKCHPGGAAARAGFQCASAVVPLDYRSPGGAKITLAVVRHPATDRARRLGTLFINPGGPAGEGTSIIPPSIHFVPATLRARFDVVSWDPRGVGESTAIKQCFANTNDENTFLGAAAYFPVGTAQEMAYIRQWAQFGQRCADRNGALLGHVTTAETARDLDLLRRAAGDPKLHYLGLSYGTYLGATYANLFPGKVGALVLDANFAPKAYTNGGKQKASLSRAQRLGLDAGGATTLAAMLRLCGQAAVADCAFSAGTAAKTRAKFEALLARLRKGPIVIGTGPAATSITYPQLLRDVFDGLYVVHPGWSALAKELQLLWLARGQRCSPRQPRPRRRRATQCRNNFTRSSALRARALGRSNSRAWPGRSCGKTARSAWSPSGVTSHAPPGPFTPRRATPGPGTFARPRRFWSSATPPIRPPR